MVGLKQIFGATGAAGRRLRKAQLLHFPAEAAITWTIHSSLAEYQVWERAHAEQLQFERELELAALSAWQEAGSPDGYLIPGYCPACRRASTFELDRNGGRVDPELGQVPNWRERQVCRQCRLNARMRVSVSIVRELVPNHSESVWLAEQVTPLFQALGADYPNLFGSEYLGPQWKSGQINGSGLRHEDCCRTSFPTGALGAVASFDVLEHVPDFRGAFAETHRVLRPGGVFIWTAPFRRDSARTIIRAEVDTDGTITHLLEPEYHGDPVNPEGGILCYQHFGWDVLDELRAAGFQRASVYQTWSFLHGLLGPSQMIFVATA